MEKMLLLIPIRENGEIKGMQAAGVNLDGIMDYVEAIEHYAEVTQKNATVFEDNPTVIRTKIKSSSKVIIFVDTL
jgi:hypothetical protein